ncbi:adhesin [Spirilliplanes yamanashiensis]|nr:adhesin [Spirilliplanes yamanashiensis]MDP9814556.1 hypothetical protein [Spirilliplanes yamanashiensis]
MRATVGPLPPAVYWRRRLVVLAGVLILVLFVALSCTGGDDDKAQPPGGTGATTPMPGASGNSGGSSTGVLTPQVDEPSFADSAPVGGGPAAPAPTDVPAGPVSAAPGLPAADPGVPPNGTGPCTDAEMALTPIPARATTKRGQPLNLQLVIKNVSARTCARDVGADVQEIYIKQGAAKIWSSDVCAVAAGPGSKVETFIPGGVRTYYVTWNGRDSSRCTGGMAAGNFPLAGQYEVMGRLGAKVSNPAPITVAA